MNDMVKLGPQTETFFNKIVKALKRFVGVFDDQELAVKVFTAFNEGKLRDPISRDEQLTAFNTAGYEKFKNAAKPITDRIGKLTDTVDSRFRESENPHLIEIIDNFNTAVGSETEKIGYYAAVAQARNRLINQLNESFTGYDREQLNNALRLYFSQIDNFAQGINIPSSGATTGRPITFLLVGQFYFDTTLGIPIWYDGTNWVDATGTVV
jgi:hypothetical protein